MLDRRRVVLAQGVYYAATGAAPFVSRRLFEAATGRKREWWLVQTVGAITTVIGGALASAALREDLTSEIIALAAGAAGALGTIDTVYASRGRIAPTYLLDAVAQGAFVVGLVAAQRRAGA